MWIYLLISTVVSLGLWYLKYSVQRRQDLKNINKELAKQKEYNEKVIEELSKPNSIDDAVNKLRSGDF